MAKKLKVDKGIISVAEAIHDVRTRNYNRYQDSHMKASVGRWTKPYQKPILTHHNSWSGEPLGRVIKSEHVQSEINPKHTTNKLYMNIVDSSAIEKILDGRYKTMSVGITAYEAICSICSTDQVKGWCGHFKGRVYDGKTCEWLIGEYNPDEASFVNSPADMIAQVIIPDLIAAESNQESRKDNNEEGRPGLVNKTAEELAAEVDAIITQESNTPPSTNEPQTEDTPPANDVPAEQNTILKDKVQDITSQIETCIEDQTGPVVEFITQHTLPGMKEAVKVLAGEIKAEEMKQFESNVVMAKKTTNLEKDLALAKDQLTIVEANAQERKGEIDALTVQNEAISKQVVEFAKFARSQAASHLVNLKILLGEATIATKESLITNFANEKLSTLVNEIKAAEAKIPNQPRKPQIVDPPKGEESSGDDESDEGEPKVTTMGDAEKALVRAFTGNKKC